MYQVIDPIKWESDTNMLEHLRFIDLDQEEGPFEGYCLLGYRTSEGALRNDGRGGAKDGPREIREELFKMHYHGDVFYDGGDLYSPEDDLEALQEELFKYTLKIIKLGLKPIILGGDHSLSWPIYRALREVGQSFSIINLDAHFDMRDDRMNSGTSFFKMKEDCEARGEDFPYYAIGIHPHQTSPELFKRASDAGVYYQEVLDVSLEELLKSLKHEKHYLSLCMDAVTSLYAKGVSAPDPLGLHPKEALAFIRALKKDTLVFSIAEVAPSLEEGNETALLAAQMIYYFLQE